MNASKRRKKSFNIKSVDVIKLFLVTEEEAKKARAFVLDKPFLLGLISAMKGEAHLSRASFKCPLLG